MTVKIGCIVEGESEVATVPLLIRRIAANLYPELPIVVPPPIRCPRNKVVKENEAESLRGQRGLSDDIHSPNDPEAIRGAKEWLSHQMENNRTYSATTDQPALATLFDIEQARQADSFDKCYRDIVWLIEELQKAGDPTNEQT